MKNEYTYFNVMCLQCTHVLSYNMMQRRWEKKEWTRERDGVKKWNWTSDICDDFFFSRWFLPISFQITNIKPLFAKNSTAGARSRSITELNSWNITAANTHNKHTYFFCCFLLFLSYWLDRIVSQCLKQHIFPLRSAANLLSTSKNVLY